MNLLFSRSDKTISINLLTSFFLTSEEESFIYFLSKYVFNCCFEGAYFSTYANAKFLISSTVTCSVFFLFLIGIMLRFYIIYLNDRTNLYLFFNRDSFYVG